MTFAERLVFLLYGWGICSVMTLIAYVIWGAEALGPALGWYAGTAIVVFVMQPIFEWLDR